MLLRRLWETKGNRTLRDAINAEMVAVSARASNGVISSVSANGTSVSYQATGKTSVDTVIDSLNLLDEMYGDAVLLLGQEADEYDVCALMLEWLQPANGFKLNHGGARW